MTDLDEIRQSGAVALSILIDPPIAILQFKPGMFRKINRPSTEDIEAVADQFVAGALANKTLATAKNGSVTVAHGQLDGVGFLVKNGLFGRLLEIDFNPPPMRQSAA